MKNKIERIKVMVVDDHAIVREGIKKLLELQEDIQVVAEAETGLSCIELIGDTTPHVILMDIKMPGIDGIEATRIIKESNPEIKVILLTNYDDEEYILESIKSNADGYLLKDIRKGDLQKVIKGTMENNTFLDPSITKIILKNIKEPADDGSKEKKLLTHRELEILVLIVDGYTNKEIAESINLSSDTVKSHLKNIYHKLNVHNRSQAAKVAIREKLVYFS